MVQYHPHNLMLPQVHQEVIARITGGVEAWGFKSLGCCESPIRGEKSGEGMGEGQVRCMASPSEFCSVCCGRSPAATESFPSSDSPPSACAYGTGNIEFLSYFIRDATMPVTINASAMARLTADENEADVQSTPL